MKLLPVVLVAGSLVFCLQSQAAEKGKLTSIQGIAAATEAKLKTAGVNSTDELLKKGASPKGREELAAKSGIGAAQILKFVNYADLMRIKGIGGQTAELLQAAGVDTVAELAKRNASNLGVKLSEVNDAKS